MQRVMWIERLAAIVASVLFATAAMAGVPSNRKVTPIVGLAPDGAPVSIEARPKQLILLDFYFANCGYCIQEVPYLNRFAKNHPNVRVIGVTFETAKQAAQFVRERDVHFEVVADAKMLIDKFEVAQYPYIVLLSSQGKPIASLRDGVKKDPVTKRKIDLIEPWFRRVAPNT